MRLLSSVPEIGIFHAVLQMLHREQNCKFYHIESRGKNNVTNLIKLQLTSFLFHMEPTYTALISIC